MLRRFRARLFRSAIDLLSDGTSVSGAPGKNRSFGRSLRHALRGILFIALNERNFRIELCFALAAVLLGVVLRIEPTEWAILATNIFLVLALEAKNTSLELTTDIATKEYDYNAKGSKDASSGGVLLAAIGSAIVGLIIFAPRLFHWIGSIVS